jgi:hypothetical protein
MSFLTKLRDFLGLGKKRSKSLRAPEKSKPPDDSEGSAGVSAKLHPLPPTLLGAAARPFPPED